MDIIHLLPDSVANQIAAGEVIQRPASVIKELVENAVDAGARNIDVVVVDAGRTSIQVVDDGKGMSDTDARLAFERHATSKILQAQDLFSLRTMGFRGEALPSIAAVAQVTLRTRQRGQELGTVLTIEGGRVTGQDIEACPEGANFVVQNLFYNIPARRKFLKSNQTELANIVHEYERIALVNPDIRFTLTSGTNTLSTLPASTTRQRIVELFGRRLGDQLLTVEVDTSLCRLTGFVGRPEAARKKGASQYFFVNGRYMRHPYFHRAVLEGFANLLPAGEQPPYFLYFDVDPAAIDVNIHPTKTEIKFDNEAEIWQILLAAVREALGKWGAVPAIEFDRADAPDLPVFQPQPVRQPAMPKVDIDYTFNPFTTSTVDSQPSTVNPQPTPALLFTEEATAMEASSQHLQYHGQYILTAVRSGLMVIDQHRAHLRILYDRYRAQMRERHTAQQGLLFPEMVQLPPSDAARLDPLLPTLHAAGFDITPLGGGSYSVTSVPAGMTNVDLTRLVTEMITADDGDQLSADLQHRVALTMARGAAITAGEALTNDEMEHLVAELFATPNPNYTPTGQVITTILREEDMLQKY